MLQVISCIQRTKKDGSGIYYNLNLVDDKGEVAAGIYSDVQFKPGDQVTADPVIVWSSSMGKNILGIRGLRKA